jgi:hypothetical protein
MRRVLPVVAIGLASCGSLDPGVVSCPSGQRGCNGTRPVQCGPSDGGILLLPAPCPTSGTCNTPGTCAPPTNAKPCAREADCGALSCIPFVDAASGSVATFCAAPEGVTAGATACTKAAQCRSDLCLSSGNTGRQACYLACQGDGDCPPSQTCRKFSVTVTGVQGTIQGCGPP